MVVYAKSTPRDDPETLAQHTQRLLDEYKTLRNLYGDKITALVPEVYRTLFWRVLEVVIWTHDLGKVHTPFQNKIRKVLKMPLLRVLEKVQELPHNLLSPAFISTMVEEFSDDIKHSMYQAIVFHHNRGVEENHIKHTDGWKPVIEAVKSDLNLDYLQCMSTLFDVSLLTQPTASYKKWLQQNIEPKDGDLYKFHVLLKGLLHRCDHSASAHLPIEEEAIESFDDLITDYLVNPPIESERTAAPIEDIWQIEATKSLHYRNVVQIASTGIGKTEFGFYWLNGEKGFYTLPVRTSVNAMYNRAVETFKTENIGLLHSDSVFYSLEDDKSNENDEGLRRNLHQIAVARQFAMPLSVSTADQLFTAVFKYPGYEKIYSTLAYSKIIIDEIQSYDPEIVAAILKCLVELDRLGGKFCIMTATLPPLYIDYLRQNISDLVIPQPRFISAQKHKIDFVDADIEEQVNEIKTACNEHGKVLVIVNTVKKAQALYEKLKDKSKVSLLHSAFIYETRRSKERDILNKPRGIWITTQLAEISLNIDFPVLFTELATVDALIQRMGRVRRFERTGVYNGDPNIIVCLKASGIGSIYDAEITQRTVEALEAVRLQTLSEQLKHDLIIRIFDNDSLKSTKYLSKFQTSLTVLESQLSINSRQEAQRIFRKISNLSVIPMSVFEKHTDEIEKAIELLENTHSKDQNPFEQTERIKALFTLKKYSLSVPIYKLSKAAITPIRGKELYGTTLLYDDDLGLLPDSQFANLL